MTNRTNPMKKAGAAAAAPATHQTSAGAGAPAPADVTPLQCQTEVARFATRVDERRHQADRVRANGLAEAIALLRDGRRGCALSVVRRTWIHQLRTLGIPHAPVPGLPYDEGGPAA